MLETLPSNARKQRVSGDENSNSKLTVKQISEMMMQKGMLIIRFSWLNLLCWLVYSTKIRVDSDQT